MPASRGPAGVVGFETIEFCLCRINGFPSPNLTPEFLLTGLQSWAVRLLSAAECQMEAFNLRKGTRSFTVYGGVFSTLLSTGVLDSLPEGQFDTKLVQGLSRYLILQTLELNHSKQFKAGV